MIFTRYLFRKFFSLFIGALLFASLVLLLIDLMINLWEFLLNEIPVGKIAYLMLLHAPKCLFYAIPFAILFGSCFALSDLYSRNELIAVYAAGVSLFKFTRSLILFSFLFSFALFAFENYLVVPTYAKKVAFQNELLNRQQSLNQSRLVVISEAGKVVYKSDYYNDHEQRLTAVYVVLRNQDKSLQAIVKADTAVWQEDRWILTNPIQYTAQGGTLRVTPLDSAVAARLTESPETFRNNTVSVEEVNAAEARAYIDKLQRSGLPVAEARSLYYKKYAFPFIVFVVVFLSVGLSGKTRKNVLIISMVFCIGAAALFYIMQMITMLLAKFGWIPPLAGAWTPVIFFTSVSVVLLRYAKT
ncbi:MAG: LptF/LptG family permease [Treponema sp.]|nr:LptF/LptG family permease [Treponema sp.]